MDANILTKYRPKTFDDVVGHAAVVAALRKSNACAYLFTGPSGVGKTTLARIIAATRDVDEFALLEIDAATHNGVDAMRGIVADASLLPMVGRNKCIIVDECHTLTKPAWQALLKSIEEPPAHVTWVFCTTESSKVPATIKTRCETYELRAVARQYLERVIDTVCANEGIGIDVAVRELVLDESYGSVRGALALLSKCHAAANVTEARELMVIDARDAEVVDLARLLFAGDRSLSKLRSVLSSLADANAESARITVMAYAYAVFVKSGDGHALRVMSHFEKPCVETNKMADVALRCARVIMGIDPK